jgi:transposase
MQSILDLGADVDSRYIMVACASRGFATHRIANERRPIVEWLRTLPRGSRIGVESTGAYHELLAELAHKAGMQVFIINARALRRYAQGIGRRGKTDRIDAEVIAGFVANEHAKLHPYVPASKEQRRLTRLIKRRATVVGIKAALAQSFSGMRGLEREVAAAKRALDRLIARLESDSKQVLSRMPEAQAAAKRIQTIPG